MYHYYQGGHYPMGGGGALIKAMTGTLKKHSAEIRTSTAVSKIILEVEQQKRAVGATLKNGQQLFAYRIVSNADFGITYNNLIGSENLSKKLQKKHSNTKYFRTALMLFQRWICMYVKRDSISEISG